MLAAKLLVGDGGGHEDGDVDGGDGVVAVVVEAVTAVVLSVVANSVVAVVLFGTDLFEEEGSLVVGLELVGKDSEEQSTIVEPVKWKGCHWEEALVGPGVDFGLWIHGCCPGQTHLRGSRCHSRPLFLCRSSAYAQEQALRALHSVYDCGALVWWLLWGDLES